MALLETVILFVSFALFALYTKWKYSYWKRRNMPYITPSFPFGNVENPLRMNYNFDEWIQKLYNDFKGRGEKHAGIYVFTTPVFFPIDPEVIKSVMLKDFDHFSERGIYYNEKDDPLSAHLFAIGGQKWRDLRTNLTPAFTPGKTKTMFGTLMNCTRPMQDFVKNKCDNREAINIKNFLERFTMDVIGSCAFGIECNSFDSSNSEFQKYAKEAVKINSPLNILKVFVITAFPDLGRSLGMLMFPKCVTGFFLDAVTKILDYRRKNNFRRKDMLQILMDLQNLNDTEIAAQCFLFFLAGSETSSNTLNYCLYELSKNQEVQSRVREEINAALSQHDNEITYEAIMELKYMTQVVEETLRKYPAVTYLTRRCVKDYRVPNTDTIIEKGTMTLIPVFSVHRDPDNFEHPEKFDPERFSDDRRDGVAPFTYIPFGEGPRLCFGKRFAYLEIKICLTILLRDFKFTLNERTKTPLDWSKFSFVLSTDSPIWVNVEEAK